MSCLRSYQYPDVFITGDCSIVMSPEGTPYPANAQIAVQQGYNAARNLFLTFAAKNSSLLYMISKGPLHPWAEERQLAYSK